MPDRHSAKLQFTPTFDKEPEKTLIITAKNRLMHKMTRPPKVRPKKSNFGGRYFYVKIQL